MAPQTRVPSRALIHALRGILFTTSCSVLLLAEERRRRLKLARTALENARKLHTAKTRRRPVQLVEARGSLEFVDQFTMTTSTKQSLDRRSCRNSLSDEKSRQLGSEGLISLPNETPKTAPVSETRPSLAALGREFLNFGVSKASSQREHLQTPDITWKPPTATTVRTPVHTYDLSLRPKPEQAAGNIDNTHPDLDLSSSHPNATDAAKKPGLYDDQLMGSLLAKLASPNCTAGEASNAVASILVVLSKLKDGMLIPKKLLKRSPQILQAVMEHEPGKMKTLLSTLLSHCKHTLDFLTPMVVEFVEKDRPDIFIPLMKYVSDKRAPEFEDSYIPRRMLVRYAKRQLGFERLERLFKMLKDAGFFQGTLKERRHEYSARRYMLFSAAEAGNDTFAESELQELLKLDADWVKSDIKLQAGTVLEKASLGDWESVFTVLPHLAKYADTQQRQLQELLSSLLKAFAEQRSATDVETLLRAFVGSYNMKMEPRWAAHVLDQYGLHRDIDGVCSWLRFCVDSGLELCDAFLKDFFRGCHFLWGFDYVALRQLDECLRVALPTLPADWAGWKPLQDLRRETPTVLERMRKHAHFGRWAEVWSLHDVACTMGDKLSPEAFRYAIQSRIELDGGSTDIATSLVRKAGAEGMDVSPAMNALMLAKLKEGWDVQELLNESLRLGIQVGDHVYNEAAIELLKEGNLRAAEDVCHLAARQNGQGHLLYNKHNFANLLFVYVGQMRYGMVESMLESFTSNPKAWHGSRRCENVVKQVMRVVVPRALESPEGKDENHKRVLEILDDAILHINRYKATDDDRKRIKETLISLAVSTSKPKRSNEPTQKDEEIREVKEAVDDNEGQAMSRPGDHVHVHDGLPREPIACS